MRDYQDRTRKTQETRSKTHKLREEKTVTKYKEKTDMGDKNNKTQEDGQH